MYSNEVVFLLDLCIFSYHLHSQSHLWPMDPYYEQMAEVSKKEREVFLTNLRQSVFGFIGSVQGFDMDDLHGPGGIVNDNLQSGWNTNSKLDPIISRYSQIYPWRPGFTRAQPGQWIVYNTPAAITDRIKSVKIAQYSSNQGYYHPSPQVDIKTLHANRPPSINTNREATDLLYCFEGGTGASFDKNKDSWDKSDEINPAHWSMMGFVLAECEQPDDPYNIYVVFRGSRSGDPRLIDAKYSQEGNPDWVTDLDFNKLIRDQEVSQFGACCRGFRTSLKTMLPTIYSCLRAIQIDRGKPPANIYVTGHSLGGALAALFTSVLRCGKFTEFEAPDNTPPSLSRPWDRRLPVKLATFGAPGVGDTILQFQHNNLTNSRRFWLQGDFVAEAAFNKEHVGAELPIPYPDRPELREVKKHFFEAHEPYRIRRKLLEFLQTFQKSDLRNLPANSGDEENDEPWKVFNNFSQVLDHFQTTGNNLKLSQLLNDYNVRFPIYLKFLNSILEDRDTKKIVEDVGKKLKERDFSLDNTPELVLAVLGESMDALNRSKLFSKDYKAFLGGSLFLIGIGKDVNVLIKNSDENYKKLLTDNF